MTRPFRFAVQAYTCTTRSEWVDLARKVEDLGFSTLHVADHYLGSGTMIEGTGHPVQKMACVPAMTAAAMVTTTLRVGSRLACVSYHEPTVLTSEMATIDVLSEGRLERPWRGMACQRVLRNRHPLRDRRASHSEASRDGGVHDDGLLERRGS